MESPPSISFAVTLLVAVAVLTATPLLQHLAELLDRLRRWSPVTALGQLRLATSADTAWPVVSDMPPRQRRSRRGRQAQPRTVASVPVERTRPVTAVHTPTGDGAVFEAPQLPPGPPSPPRGEPAIGDVVSSSEQPVLELEPGGDQLNVVVNVSYARSEHGQRAVRVLDRRGQVLLQLTAAQAHQLALDLTQSADVVGSIRVAAGYDN